jgi:hypothetical protein
MFRPKEHFFKKNYYVLVLIFYLLYFSFQLLFKIGGGGADGWIEPLLFPMILPQISQPSSNKNLEFEAMYLFIV